MMTNGNRWGMGMLTAVVLALVCAAAVQAQSPRSVWIYHGGEGSFVQETFSPGRWVERTHLDTVYVFKEVYRAPDYVELYDASRGIWIRLYNHACYIRHSGTGGRFDLLYRGNWAL